MENGIVDGRQEAIQQIIREGMAAGHGFSYQVISQSMSPQIRAGDRVGVRPVSQADLRPGDIISLIAADGGFVTHRFLGLVDHGEGRGLLTKGDRSLMLDPVWPSDSLVGRVETISRGNKQIDLSQGRGKAVGRLFSTVFVSEWHVLGGASRSLLVRVVHRVIVYLSQIVSWFAWRMAYDIISPQPDL